MELYALTDSMIVKKIGGIVRRRRLEKNITQSELSQSSGVALSSIVALESGKNVSVVTLISLLRALDALDFLGHFVEEPKVSPIAYLKLMEKSKSRQRASIRKKSLHKRDNTEW